MSRCIKLSSYELCKHCWQVCHCDFFFFCYVINTRFTLVLGLIFVFTWRCFKWWTEKKRHLQRTVQSHNQYKENENNALFVYYDSEQSVAVWPCSLCFAGNSIERERNLIGTAQWANRKPWSLSALIMRSQRRRLEWHPNWFWLCCSIKRNQAIRPHRRFFPLALYPPLC